MPDTRDRKSSSEIRISAVAVSRGVGIGRVVEYRDEDRNVTLRSIDAEAVDVEINRVRKAIAQCRFQLEKVVDAYSGQNSDEVIAIFRIHLAILLDSSLASGIEQLISEQTCNAEWAVRKCAEHLSRNQSKAESVYFREKRLDFEDVCDRVIDALAGHSITDRRVFSGAVIVARELRPSTILELQRSKPAAFMTEQGGWTSHASIVAREFRIPMITGVRAGDHGIRVGDHVIVDGSSGVIVFHPSAGTLDGFSINPEIRAEGEVNIRAGSPGIALLDGTKITLRANADIPESYKVAQGLGLEGIGLFRSESLIRRPGRIPTEDEQFEAYVEAVQAAGEHGVKIRTFDIGIDRFSSSIIVEQNPALGLRSIRLSFQEESYFRCQIRALLRSAAYGRLDIVLPMVSGPAEVVDARKIIDDERRNLIAQGISVGPTKLGAMIEVPAAVLTALEIARRADFLSVGTNDLVQYLLAVDRDNYAVSQWYQTLHPAVIRALRTVVDSAEAAAIPLLVCGEMAASMFYLPILLGLGVRELSVNVNSIRQIRQFLANITLAKCEAVVDAISAFESARETEDWLRQHYANNWAGLMPQNLFAG